MARWWGFSEQRAALAAAALWLAATVAPVVGAPPAHSPLALSCLGCHQGAVDAPEMPALDRLAPARIAAALKHARDAPQPGLIMPRFAATLSDAEIAQLAAELGRRGSR